MQKWFLFYFFGDDSEVNINSYKNPEFSAWKWADTKYIENNVTEFRKSVYKTVFEKFEADIKNETN
jgi:putative (di)nucleoside polyphosphate hydrolase